MATGSGLTAQTPSYRMRFMSFKQFKVYSAASDWDDAKKQLRLPGIDSTWVIYNLLNEVSNYRHI